jgi:peptidoglycan hydrolase-like protein with peptidoglycan-binding domain
VIAPWAASKHPRAQGGRFAAGARDAAAGHPSGAWARGPMSFNGKTGAGYGVHGGDERVTALQQALNRLGVTDGRGRPLVVDGRLGPRTTEAVKAAQKRLGLKPDGVVTAQVMVAILEMKAPQRTGAKKSPRTARTLMRAGKSEK